MSNWTPCDNTSSLVSSHYSIDHTLGSWTLTPHLLIIFIIPATLTIVPLFLVTISSYFPVTPLWHKELHHTQDHIGNSALYWVSFPAVFMPSGPASGWPLASSPLCLWRASVHRASLHFRHLLCLQTSSSNTTISPILVTVWSWHLPARSGCLLLTEKLPTPCQTPTAHYVLHGEPQCTADVQRKGHTTHTYTAGWPFYSHSRSTKPYSCPKPIASSCREPTESTSWTFRTRPPSLLPSFTFYNFYLLLLLISLPHMPPFTSPSTRFCQFLASSLPTHKTQWLCHSDFSLYRKDAFANPTVHPSVFSGQQSPLFVPILPSAHIITHSGFCHRFLSLPCYLFLIRHQDSSSRSSSHTAIRPCRSCQVFLPQNRRITTS